jgi:hypothetical protein
LQKAAYKLKQIIAVEGLNVSVEKRELIASEGREPFRSKIVRDNKIIEEVNFFNYLGNFISYEKMWTLITN